MCINYFVAIPVKLIAVMGTAAVLVSYCLRSSAVMVWIMLYKQVLVFHNEEYQLPVPSQCLEMLEKAKITICLLDNPI